MTYTTIEYVSAQLGGIDINSSSTPSSSDITTWIGEAESEINIRTGNLYSSTLVSSTVYDWENNDNILRVDGNILSVSEFQYSASAAGTAPSWVAKTEDTDFYVYGEHGEIEFIPSNFKPLEGKKRFNVSYIKGSNTVPGLIQRLATLLVAQRVVQTVVQNQAYANSGGEVQVGTIKVGNPSAFSTNSYSAMGSEVDALFEKVVGQNRIHRIERVY